MNYKYLEYSSKKGLTLKEKPCVKAQLLNAGRVCVGVEFSGVNYKDALGVTGRAAIFKKDPLIPGIDFSGVCQSGKFKGELVLAQGCGLGESLDGGYTEQAILSDDLLIPMPEGLTSKESMALGTAGFTAGLAVYRMLQNEQNSDKGKILISGATGGVGGFAVQILKKIGFEVHAVTHRMEYLAELKRLGCDEVHSYDKLFSGKSRALDKVKWGGVIDNLGGEFLSKVLPQVGLWGNVASIGLAKSEKYSSTVMPYILRGVSVLGISSTNCSMEVRKKIWKKLGKDWKPDTILERVSETLKLEEILGYSEKLLDHKTMGRAVVDVKAR